MRVRSIHPHVWHSTGKLVFQPVGDGYYYEGEVNDEVAKSLIEYFAGTGHPEQFSAAPPLGSEEPSRETLVGNDEEAEGVEEELVDDPADEMGSEEKPVRRGRRGGSRVV